MENIIKKTLAVVAIIMLTVILNGCGSTSTNTTANNLQLYEGGEFTINIDPSWKVINKSDFYAEIPQETVVAFTTPESYDGFFINVNVVKETLQQEIAAIDYARANINLSAQNLTDYEKIQEAKIDLGGIPTMVHIFQARLNPTEKLIRFVQLYATKGNNGYIVTGGMLPSTPKELRDQVGAVVTSFMLR
ncbi:hypothetical protein JW758_00595 [Candidatus Peregrinibacteria bacterium]|nr:hypothetical protein [Candidatus Peregrinibacteria bacterium]